MGGKEDGEGKDAGAVTWILCVPEFLARGAAFSSLKGHPMSCLLKSCASVPHSLPSTLHVAMAHGGTVSSLSIIWEREGR